jgi:hypothetical protein
MDARGVGPNRVPKDPQSVCSFVILRRYAAAITILRIAPAALFSAWTIRAWQLSAKNNLGIGGVGPFELASALAQAAADAFEEHQHCVHLGLDAAVGVFDHGSIVLARCHLAAAFAPACPLLI